MRFLLIFFLSALIWTCSNNDESIYPEKRDITESVYSSVTVQPDSLYDAFSAVAGIIEKVLVEEGDVVKRGQPLIQIINSTPKLNTENARLALDLAKDNYEGQAAILEGIQDEINAATLRYKNDSINFFRQKNLWEQNIGSKIDYDTKRLNYELSENSLKLLQSRYDRTKNELATALQQAENNYRASLINTSDFTVESKIEGKIYAIEKNQGELVTTLQSLAKVGSETDFILELQVDEVDIVKVSQDQKILVTLDAYENQVFEGKVTKILPNKNIRNQTFIVEGVLNEPPDVLYPGLSGESNIIIGQREAVLTIPREYLIDGQQVKTADGLVKVELGIGNLDLVEVLSGIDENTAIYKPD